MKRKEDANGGSVVFRLGVTLNADPATVSFDKVLRNEETDACTNCGPGGEESVENLGQSIRVDTLAVVCNVHGNAVRRNGGITDRNKKSATAGHRIDGVCDQVRNHLHHLAATKHNLPP